MLCNTLLAVVLHIGYVLFGKNECIRAAIVDFLDVKDHLILKYYKFFRELCYIRGPMDPLLL